MDNSCKGKYFPCFLSCPQLEKSILFCAKVAVVAKNAFLGTEQSMLQLGDVHDDGGASPTSPSCWFEDAPECRKGSGILVNWT